MDKIRAYYRKEAERLQSKTKVIRIKNNGKSERVKIFKTAKSFKNPDILGA